MDAAVKEFFEYLKSSGLYDNSMIVLYGDHYGLSPSQHKTLAPVLGYDPDTWNASFNNTQMQRVPFMIHAKGLKGGVKHEYGGEIDVLPTILHLAGVNTKGYAQVGTDLLSKDHSQIVAFRNGNYITPRYTVIRSTKEVYENTTGQLMDLKENPVLSQKVARWNDEVDEKLQVSDNINKLNLLRFYTPVGFKPVDPSQYNYFNQVKKMVKIRNSLGSSSTSLYSKNNNTSTTSLYQTDAPEVKDSGRDSIDNLYDVQGK